VDDGIGLLGRGAPLADDTIIHGLVPIIAACSYFAMATGQGSILLPAGPDALGRGAPLADEQDQGGADAHAGEADPEPELR
jgi:hypothetical protein